MRKPHSLFCTLLVATLWLHYSSSTYVISAIAQTAPAAGAEARERGIALYKQGKNAEAVAALKGAVKKYKTDYQVWYFLGLAQIKDEDFKDAAKSLENAVKLKPDFALGHNALSYTALMRNKSSEAIRGAELALRLDPGIKEARYIIGVANLRTGNKEEALKQAEAVIKIDSKFSAAYLLKSQALSSFLGYAVTQKPGESTESRRVSYLEAATALEKYLQLEPNAEHKQTWLEQLDSLRFYVISHREGRGPDRVYSGAELTTKARVLSKPEPKYTEAARRSQITGTVVLRCIFTADGTVKHLLVVDALPYGLTEAALAAARRIKFTPATLDGKQVSVFIQLEYNFNRY